MNTRNHNNVFSNNGIRMIEPKDAKALDMNVLRPRESGKNRRNNIDWFSF